jgi:hypothetical protein
MNLLKISGTWQEQRLIGKKKVLRSARKSMKE